ncbi:MAG TPA: chemotaxis protein CheD [Chloroflexota bacterium]|nr:chemotaxis protein CheD [Chloroflexota bacterium]
MVATASSAVGVGLGELQVARDGELVAYSLGSCVAICLYDPLAKVAGMAHVVLPAVPEKGAGTAPGKFADTAVPALLAAMQRAGAAAARLHCRLAGGAAVLAIGGTGSLPPIGQRNVEAVKAALALARVRVRAEDTGGTQGRTVRLDAASGRVMVRKVSGPEVEL